MNGDCVSVDREMQHNWWGGVAGVSKWIRFPTATRTSLYPLISPSHLAVSPRLPPSKIEIVHMDLIKSRTVL